VNPDEAQEYALDASRIHTLLRRYFPFYCVLAALATFGYALYDSYQIDGDAVAYMDIADNLRSHHWAGIINGYWHPMYPAFLSMGHMLFGATLATELRAYYMVNFGIFLLGMLAVVCFTDALAASQQASKSASQQASYLLDRTMLRYLGVALVVIASQRELSLGKIRPDALLQAFLLMAIAALLRYLVHGNTRYAAWMGLVLGCAYLSKSFAFVFALLCILVMAVFSRLWLKQEIKKILPAVLIALTCFVIVAGPYVTALSIQRGRFDFGDSGALNYAWYVGGTEKMHLQPSQTGQFGSSEVNLKHPEKVLLHAPQILSYAAMPYGTYPDWFDTSYWNDQIKPHFRLRDDLPRFARNCVLIVRYLFNHPEALILLALLFVFGARIHRQGRIAFWLVPLLLGLAIWGIYGLVNTEERYVTVAYFTLLLTVFSALRVPDEQSETDSSAERTNRTNFRDTASVMVVLLALLATGESLRTVFEDRRQLSIRGYPGGWYSPNMVHVADGLQSMGVHAGDHVACIGPIACLNDPYWARLAGVRILTEIYDPATPVAPFLAGLHNREQVLDIVRGQGAKVMVGDFGNDRVRDSDPAFRNWQQLGDTTYYALPLN